MTSAPDSSGGVGAERARAYLIAGAGGMLGTALQRVLTGHGERFEAPAEGAFDITDAATVASTTAAFAASLPPATQGVLVNAAAFTNVEAAEDDPRTAYRVNELGARLLAEAAARAGLRFAHVSTDFVFDGAADGAYAEDAEVGPLSVYGASKLAGERAVACANPDALIVRTAWVFGPGGANFPRKILELASRLPALKVVSDEAGSPTYTPDLASGILALDARDAFGIYHLVGSGSCSRHEFARAILRDAGIDVPVEPVSSAEFPTKARRPANSVLDCGKAAALGVTMPEWRDALARFLAEEGRHTRAVDAR